MNKKGLALSSGLALGLLTAAVIAQQAGQTVIADQPLSSDQYFAGRFVQVSAPIEGDLVIAGQELIVNARIGGDLIAAGQSLVVTEAVADDVRAAGRTLTLDAQIAGHAVAAGAEVILSADASVGNWAWFAGRNVAVEGRVGEELRAAGQNVEVTGEVGGNVVVAAEEIHVGPGAIIRGDLIWDSDEEPDISANATVEGEIVQEDLTDAFEDLESFGELGGVASAVFFAIALIVASLTAFLLFPNFSASVSDRIRSMPLQTLAYGIGVLVGIPIVVMLLFVSRIGWIVAIGTLFGYLLLLLCAFLFGIVSIGKLALKLTNRDELAGLTVNLIAIALAVVLFRLLAQVPILGTIVLLSVLIGGLGALTGEFWQRYRSIA